MSETQISMPATARAGEVITVKTLLRHAMETGRRRGPGGQMVPRMIVTRVSGSYNGRPVFEADWSPAISANPYLAFTIRARDSGVVTVTWTDDGGRIYVAEAKLTVV